MVGGSSGLAGLAFWRTAAKTRCPLVSGVRDARCGASGAPVTGLSQGLTNSLPQNERYTCAFEGVGNLQTLDRLWVSSNLLNNGGALYDVVHANAEFFDQVSDHDPILLTLSAMPAPVPEPAALALMLLGLIGVATAARRGKGAQATAR